jgi:hypothetical protein
MDAKQNYIKSNVLINCTALKEDGQYMLTKFENKLIYIYFIFDLL